MGNRRFSPRNHYIQPRIQLYRPLQQLVRHRQNSPRHRGIEKGNWQTSCSGLPIAYI